MADNTVLNSGTGGDTIRDVDRLGVKTQVVGLDLNPGGAEVLMSGGMPISFMTGTTTAMAGSADYDTGPGSGQIAMIGVAVPAAGGAQPGGTAATPFRVDPTGTTTQPVSFSGTIPVSGTFWQATQPVGGTITANAGTGTFAISAAALPLPTGAATAAKQPAPGTAGTPSTDVLTVQGAAAMTAVKVDGSAVTQPVSGTVSAAQSGAWNVGTVTTVATVSAVTAIANALPAGTNLIGRVSASGETGTVYNGTTALTPKFAPISASASGATTVVAAVVAKKIRILRWSLVANGAVNVNWQSHATTGTATGLRYMTQFATAGGSYCPVGIFETAAGEALDLNLSAAVAVGGELTYVEV